MREVRKRLEEKLLSDTERAANTGHAVLYALNVKTGKILYQSDNAVKSWVHFSGLAVVDGFIYPVDSRFSGLLLRL